MSCYRVALAAAFILAACLAHASSPEREAQHLWQEFQALKGEPLGSGSTLADWIAMHRSAAALLAAAEHDEFDLTRSRAGKLERILQHRPRGLASAAGHGSDLGLDGVRATGTISGTITEDGAGTPLPGITVQTTPFGGDTFAGNVSATTDGSGNFSLTVAEGLYVLQVTRAGSGNYIPEAWPDLRCVNPQLCSPWYGGQVIQVTGGGTVTADFALEPGVRVAGTVENGSGTPVENALVTVLAADGDVQATASTDAGGFYSAVPPLPPGDYRIYVTTDYDGQGTDTTPSGLIGRLHDGQDCQSGCRRLDVTLLTLTDVTIPVVQDFTLNPGFGLDGTVTEDGTTPLAGASVELVSTDGRTSTFHETDAAGAFDTGPLRATDYTIIVTHPERLSLVHPGVTCFDNDCAAEVGTPVSLGSSAQTLNFTLPAGASVTGTVVRDSDSAALDGARVTVGNTIQGYRFATTDSSGTYTVSGLAAGTHYVSVQPQSDLQRAYRGNVNCPDFSCGDFGQPLSVPASGSVAAGEIRLEPGGAVSGTITDALTGAELNALFSARLELFVASGPNAGELAAQVFPDFSSSLSGDYVAEGLKPGAYKAVFASSTHLGLVDTSFGGQACPRGSCNLTSLPTVFVTAGAVTSGISAALPRGPVISGRVTDQSTGGAPEPLPLSETGNRVVSVYGTSGNYAGFDFPDDAGFYRTRTGFPNGTYFVSTYSSRNDNPFGGNYVDEVYDDVDCPRLTCNLTASATGVTVAGSDIANIDFALRKGGGISGSVFDADTPATVLAGVGIEVYDASGDKVATGNTDALGDYEIAGLPAGDYTVRTRNSQGYVDELHDDGACALFCDPIGGTPVTVVEGSTTGGVDFGLVESVGVSGTVTVAGVPTGNITVELYGALGNFLAQTLSASDGSYGFTGLAPGEYYLRTRNPFGNADVLYNGNPCVGDACQVRRGDAIVLTAGSSLTGVSLDLQTGATISGTIEDADTSSALSGIRVQLLDDRGAIAFEQTSGPSGGFAFDGLSGGNYHLVTRETPGYIDEAFTTTGGEPCPTACNGLNGDAIAVLAGGSTSLPVIGLSQGGEISGSVTAGGSPAVGAQVQVYNAGGVPVSQVPTNASGNYQVDTLPDGNFFVRALGVPGYISELFDDRPCSGYCDVVNGDPVTLSGGTGGGSTDFALAAGGAIAGNVSSGGTGLPGVEVLAYDTAGFVAGTAVTDSAGNYSIGALLNGSYRVQTVNTGGFVDEVYGGDTCSPTACVLSSGSALAVSGGTVGNIDFDLATGSSISGTATDTFGNPLPGGTAVLLDGDGIEVRSVAITDGLWRFDGLADGTYYVLIENTLGLVDELYDGVSCPAGACDITGLGTPIVVSASPFEPAAALGRGSQINGLDVTLETGRAVGGSVVDSTSGSPLFGVTVYVFDAEGNLASFGTTDGLGEYVTGGGLPEGTYYAATASGSERGAGDGYVNALYQGAECLLDCDPTAGTPFTVDADGAGGIDFTLQLGSGLRGTVLGPNDDPAVQVDVLVYDADGFLAGQARTDSLGNYEVDGLPAGDYFAHTANAQALADETFGGAPCEGGCDPADSDPITVSSGSFTDSVDFTLGILDPIFGDDFEQQP